MRIRTKFVLAFGLLLAIMIGSESYSYVQEGRIKAASAKMLGDAELLTHLREIQFVLTGRNNDERGYLLSQDNTFAEEMRERAQKLDALFAQAKEMAGSSEELRRLLDRMEALFRTYQRESDKVMEAIRSGQREEAVRLHFGEERQARKELDRVVEELVTLVQQEKEQDEVLLARQARTAESVRLFVAMTAVLLAVLIGGYLVRSIVIPLNRVNAQLRAIAEGEGDLTRELTVASRDEIGMLGQSFNRMLRNLREIILQVRSHAEQVAASAEELNASSEQTSQAAKQIAETVQGVVLGTDKQVQGVEEGSREVQEMAAGIRQISSRAERVTAAAVDTSELATNGNRTIQEAVARMNGMSETIDHLSRLVRGLGERSRQIGQIVDAITDIAGQTNLLALNAAIEAARAGEHGRGFAVVADEVRKLAEQASASAGQITQLVGTIQSEIEEAVVSMQRGTEEVAAGMAGVSEAGEAFARIRAAVLDVTGQIQEVSAASRSLTASTEKVAQAMREIAGVTETTAARTLDVSAATEEQLASMEEIHASAASLAGLAEELEKLMGRFKV
ncbi:methyl-accepting chemotaxis protein [Brevibacillus thermoruber]|uniref:Methyl-accepting chemotaxis protein n=1 Tax=Brevibacillus thermoruber TaxID=33942 RepID=A0A9X3TR38_9BACL|nr:methyl-accepting chemotaxis protein [Brevibacillus thermoruber]MDA5109252.1 methyl-accepting chemotaxis protein [Brevibacillus thermoruber]